MLHGKDKEKFVMETYVSEKIDLINRYNINMLEDLLSGLLAGSSNQMIYKMIHDMIDNLDQEPR